MIAPTAFSSNQTVNLDKANYDKHPCYDQIVNIEYIDRVAFLFNDMVNISL